jgi:hypothetical protein
MISCLKDGKKVHITVYSGDTEALLFKITVTEPLSNDPEIDTFDPASIQDIVHEIKDTFNTTLASFSMSAGSISIQEINEQYYILIDYQRDLANIKHGIYSHDIRVLYTDNETVATFVEKSDFTIKQRVSAV